MQNAALTKVIERKMFPEEWKLLRLTFHRGSLDEALGAAARRAKETGRPRYVFALAGGFQVSDFLPDLVIRTKYWRITAEQNNTMIRGELWEVQP